MGTSTISLREFPIVPSFPLPASKCRPHLRYIISLFQANRKNICRVSFSCHHFSQYLSAWECWNVMGAHKQRECRWPRLYLKGYASDQISQYFHHYQISIEWKYPRAAVVVAYCDVSWCLRSITVNRKIVPFSSHTSITMAGAIGFMLFEFAGWQKEYYPIIEVRL